MKVSCPTCEKERDISKAMYRLIERGICSGNCKSCSLKGNQYLLGHKASEETKLKMSLAKLGKKKTKEHAENISKGLKGREVPWQIGSNNYRWIEDRTQLKDDYKDRGGQLHREWSKQVKNRDMWKCKINNDECNGKLEAHHILSWAKFPELRYNIDNGITLCKYHHPRKEKEVEEMVPYFNQLIAIT